MSSARQALTIVGQVAGAAFGPIGAAVGGIIGGEIGGAIDGPPEGPRLGDLSAPQIEYGGKIPRLYGGPKWFEVIPQWMSEKREESEVVGGKGGDSGQEQFSYRCDMLFKFTESREDTPCEVIAVTGVEIDGQLVWTSLADATNESLQNSASQEDWASMTLLAGSETQSPWSVYEAAVGAANANAHRGYCTVGFENMLLGQGGMPRRVRVQLITAGTNEGAALPETHTFVGRAFEVGALDPPYDFDEYTGDQYFRVGGDWRLDVDVYAIGDDAATSGDSTIVTWRTILDSNSNLIKQVDLARSHNLVGTRLVLQVDGGAVYGPYGAYEGDLSIRYTESDDTTRLLLNNVEIASLAGFGGGPSSTTALTTSTLTIGISNAFPDDFSVYEVRLTLNSGQADAWVPEPVPLRDILEYEAERCAPLTSADIDFSAADGLEVDCHVGIGSAAEVMQPLLTRFWFDLFSSDKLTLVRRGGSVEQTIPFAWSGAGEGEGFAGLIRDNDVEVPKKTAITFANLLADGETDTRTGDRESPGSDVETLNLNLHMVPTEGQGLADTATADKRVAAHTARIRVGARHGLKLQPGSVDTFVDHAGNSYRCLVRRIVWDRWAWELDVRLDDPAVLQEAGIAVDVDQRAIEVAAPPEATLYVLDIPLLRAQDDSAGEYVAVTCTGRWRGATLYKSPDDVTFTNRGEVANRATAGVCDSLLPAFTGWGWDNSSTLTVTLDEGSGGTLSSATKAAIEADRSLNLAAIGAHGRWELVQFATATLTTGTTYTLTGFLRNLFGSEWASADHAAGDAFVLLTPALGRISGTVDDLGQTRYYKAVPRGRSIGNVDSASIDCEEQCLLPYAPADVRNDAGTVRWNRRSRLVGAVGIDPPLGEASERYDAELYSGVTLDEDELGLTTAEWAPSSPSGKTARVYQLSELVGRGHVAEAELT